MGDISNFILLSSEDLLAKQLQPEEERLQEEEIEEEVEEEQEQEVEPTSPRPVHEEANELFKTLKLSIAANPFVQRDRARASLPASRSKPWLNSTSPQQQHNHPHYDSPRTPPTDLSRSHPNRDPRRRESASKQPQEDPSRKNGLKKSEEGLRVLEQGSPKKEEKEKGEGTEKEGDGEDGDTSPIAGHRTSPLSRTPISSKEELIIEENQPFSMSELVNSLSFKMA